MSLLRLDHLDKVEYRSAIRFCLLLGQSSEDIKANLFRAYGDKCPSQTTIKFWIAEFKRGRQLVDDEERKGRPRTSDNEENRAKLERLVLEDRKVTTRQLAETLKLSKGSVGEMLHDMRFSKVASRFVPRFLTDEMCARRREACQANLDIHRRHGDYFLNNIITVDETPLSLYAPESRRESLEWRRPDEGKVWKQRSGSAPRRKMMLTAFWNAEGIIFLDFLQREETVTGAYYGELVRQVRSKVRKPRGLPHWFLQDNAPVHTCQTAMEKINSAGFELVQHPPYSPDLAPSDYCLFNELKRHLRGKRFESAEALEATVRNCFALLPPAFFVDAFKALPVRWEKCLAANGNWFEK